MVVVSADATNYYDWIAHLIASMVCQHFSLSLEYLLILFGTIQTLKIFLRTSFSLLLSYYTETKALSFQGGEQENGATPLTWLIISIFLVRYLYSSKFVSVSKIAII